MSYYQPTKVTKSSSYPQPQLAQWTIFKLEMDDSPELKMVQWKHDSYGILSLLFVIKQIFQGSVLLKNLQKIAWLRTNIRTRKDVHITVKNTFSTFWKAED